MNHYQISNSQLTSPHSNMINGNNLNYNELVNYSTTTTTPTTAPLQHHQYHQQQQQQQQPQQQQQQQHHSIQYNQQQQLSNIYTNQLDQIFDLSNSDNYSHLNKPNYTVAVDTTTLLNNNNNNVSKATTKSILPIYTNHQILTNNSATSIDSTISSSSLSIAESSSTSPSSISPQQQQHRQYQKNNINFNHNNSFSLLNINNKPTMNPLPEYQYPNGENQGQYHQQQQINNTYSTYPNQSNNNFIFSQNQLINNYDSNDKITNLKTLNEQTPPNDPETTIIYDAKVAAEIELELGLKRPNGPKKNSWGNLSYAELISRALETSPNQRLTLAQIYDWIIQYVPYFQLRKDKTSSAGWKVNLFIKKYN
jgi:hypothetical protein